MHPVLLTLPLPALSLPLFGVALGVLGLGLVVTLAGYRAGLPELRRLGLLVSFAATAAAPWLWGLRLTLGPLRIGSYGALLSVSLLVGWVLSVGLAVRGGLPRAAAVQCYFVTLGGALLGARAHYVLVNGSEYPSLSAALALRQGGLSLYGGLLGGLLGAALYLRRARLPLLPWADAAVPSVAVGLALTRVGCWLHGCDYGAPLAATTPGWLRALGSFPHWPDGLLGAASGAPAWVAQVRAGALSPEQLASLPVHPTQLYEALAGALLFALLSWLGRRSLPRGALLLSFAFGYGALRFGLELWRGDPERGLVGPFFAAPWLLPAAALALGLAFGVGPARAVVGPRRRLVARLLALLPAAALALGARLGAVPAAPVLQLSSSQWLALTTALLAALLWGRLPEPALPPLRAR